MKKLRHRHPMYCTQALNRSSPNFVWVITSRTCIHVQNFIHLQWRFSFSYIHDFAQIIYSAKFGIPLLPTVRTLAETLMHSMSKDAVLCMNVPFCIITKEINIWTLLVKMAILGSIFYGTLKTFTDWKCSLNKLPSTHNAHCSPIKLL